MQPKLEQIVKQEAKQSEQSAEPIAKQGAKERQLVPADSHLKRMLSHFSKAEAKQYRRDQHFIKECAAHIRSSYPYDKQELEAAKSRTQRMVHLYAQVCVAADRALVDAGAAPYIEEGRCQWCFDEDSQCMRCFTRDQNDRQSIQHAFSQVNGPTEQKQNAPPDTDSDDDTDW